MLKFITMRTIDTNGENIRNVTIAYSRTATYILGNLEHGTLLVIDQKLVDQLQKLVNYQDSKAED